MEEVDKIIIFTLTSLNCNVEEGVNSIKKLNTDSFVEGVVKMIQIIDPNFVASKSLPSSMSAKYKYCADLSDKVKSLGFQGDIGYQTFLYGNEIEVRRTLMFLIERLPREQSVKTSDSLTKLESFKEKLSNSMTEKVISSKTEKFLSMPIETGIVKPGQTKKTMTPREWREYCLKDLKFITHQVKPNIFFPSIISLNAYEGDEVKDPFPTIKEDDNASQNQTANVNNTNSIPRDVSQSDLNQLSQNIQTEIEEIIDLKQEYQQLEIIKNEAEIQLNKDGKDIDLLEKINIMLPDAEDYTEKLLSKINSAHEKMEHLQEQWEQAKIPYLEEKNRRTKKQSSTSQHYEQLKQLRESAQLLRKEYETKTNTFNELNEKLPIKSVNRSSYTKRILDIINNIKKQDSDIIKIITDTKQVQKQLNNVNGKIERCFTLADEMIFKDVTRDDVSRKAYKYLVNLHTDCNEIVKVVTETGNLKKEMKNLEEQIDLLCNKNIGENLLQIQKDILHMKNESNALEQQMKISNKELTVL